MEQLFKDWSDYIVGIPALLISIYITFYVFNRQRNVKKLGFIKIIDYNLFDIHIEARKSEFSVSPCLINPKDYFLFRIILDNENGEFNILSRIAGVDRINEIPSNETQSPTPMKLFIFSFPAYVMVSYMVYYFFSHFLFVENSTGFSKPLISVIATVTILLMIILPLVVFGSTKKRK